MVWGLDQRYRCFECFKIHARHLLRLPGRVCAVTIAWSLGVAGLERALAYYRVWSVATAPSWPATAASLALPCGAAATSDPMPWPPYRADVLSRCHAVSLSLAALCYGPLAAAAPLSLPLYYDAATADTMP